MACLARPLSAMSAVRKAASISSSDEPFLWRVPVGEPSTASLAKVTDCVCYALNGGSYSSIALKRVAPTERSESGSNQGPLIRCNIQLRHQPRVFIGVGARHPAELFGRPADRFQRRVGEILAQHRVV